MKEFFIECLKDLESLTGLRQLYFLQSDLEDGERKKNVLIQGMILAAQDYPYIPEDAQKKIIRDQMVKDQNYDALHARVIHRWLGGASAKYWNGQPQETEKKEAPIAPPEVADQYIKQIQENIARSGRKVPAMTKEEIEKFGQEKIADPMVQNLKDKFGTDSHKNPRPEFIVGEECPLCKGDGIQSGELDDSIEPQPCAKCNGAGIINCAVVNAASQDEADKAYHATINQKTYVLQGKGN